MRRDCIYNTKIFLKVGGQVLTFILNWNINIEPLEKGHVCSIIDFQLGSAMIITIRFLFSIHLISY